MFVTSCFNARLRMVVFCEFGKEAIFYVRRLEINRTRGFY